MPRGESHTGDGQRNNKHVFINCDIILCIISRDARVREHLSPSDDEHIYLFF